MTIVIMLGGGHILRWRGPKKLVFWLTRFQVMLRNEISVITWPILFSWYIFFLLSLHLIYYCYVLSRNGRCFDHENRSLGGRKRKRVRIRWCRFSYSPRFRSLNGDRFCCLLEFVSCNICRCAFSQCLKSTWSFARRKSNRRREKG